MIDSNYELTVIGYNSTLDSTLSYDEKNISITIPRSLEIRSGTAGVVTKYTVMAIDDKAFMNLYNLTKFEIEDGITIGSQSFANCEKLTYQYFNSTIAIKSKAFENCSNLNIKLAYRDSYIDIATDFAVNCKGVLYEAKPEE